MSNIIPKISTSIEILPFDNGGFLVHHKTLGHRLNINNITHQLLNFVDGKRNIKEIAFAFKQDFAIDINEEKIYDILYKQLAKYHIIENDEYEFKQKEKPSYLKLSFTVLKKDWIDIIISKLLFLFSKKLFYPLFFSTLLFMIFMISFNYDIMLKSLEELNFMSGVFYFVLFAIVIFFHEFGHAAACNKFGAEHGDIGFGFYLLSPVMYADVSDAWRLKRSERIIVNLGGIYFQLIIATFFSLLYLITKNINFLIPAYTIGGLSVLYNLNPFFRTDGYWILSDYTGIANLRKKSNKSLQQLIKKILRKENYEFSTKNILLTIHALVSFSFIIIFLFTILISNPNSILNYPFDLFDYIAHVYEYKELNTDKLKMLILPTIFFVLLSLFIIKIYKTKIMALNRNNKREILIIIIKIILATVFFLSAVGKTLDFNSFSQKIEKFDVLSISFIPHIILFIEYLLAIGFMSFLFTRKLAKIATVFLVIMTFTYSIGYFFMDITNCDCFGYFSILTPSNYFIFIIKNGILIFLCLYLILNNNSIVNRIRKTIVSILVVFSLSLFVYKMEVRYINNFALQNIGQTVQELSLNKYTQLKNYEYWFVFSPKCPHCIEAIPKIMQFRNENKLSLIGIISKKNEKETQKLNIDFPVQKLDSKVLLTLTRTVPKIFEIKNDTIKGVYNVKQFLKKKNYN